MRSRRWEPAPAFVPPAGYTARVVAGVMVPLLTVVSALLFWVGAYAVLSLVTERQAFGVPLSDDIPLWAGILFLVLLYQSAAWPLHAARRASYHALGGPHHAAVAALDGLLSVGVGLCVVWFAYQYMPEVRELLRTLPDVWDSMRR
jgi:multisubunit Na+/H+ antiporter MnhB subunit